MNMLSIISKYSKKTSNTEFFFLLIALIFGSYTILVTPLGAGFDEDTHLIRVWEEANFIMLPQEMSARNMKFPEVFIDLSYRKQALIKPEDPDLWKKYGTVKMYDYGYHQGPLSPRSAYSPPLLLPQALAIRYLGLKWNLPVLMVFYASRFAGLLCYILLAWLAIRTIPFGKWVLAVLAVAPMAIYQASTINADTITNGIGLFFIAGCLALYQKRDLDLWDVGKLLFLMSILFLAKPNTLPLLLLPFLIIFPSNFKKRAAYLLLVIGTITLFLIEVGGWYILSSSDHVYFDRDGINPIGQISYILSHPLTVTKIIFSQNTSILLQQWMGIYGYGYGSVPLPMYVFFLIGLGFSLFLVTNHQYPNNKLRISMTGLFLLSYVAVYLMLYVSFTRVGLFYISGVQGRYFIPLAPVLLLAASELSIIKKIRVTSWMVMIPSVVALLIYTIGLFLSYHVNCGVTYYNFELCYQPTYKNFSPENQSQPITRETILVQEFVPDCDNMTELRIRINSKNKIQTGMTEFLVTNTQSNSNLLDLTVPNTQLAIDDWYTLKFKPEQNSKNTHYTFTLRGTDLKDGINVVYSLRPEYPLGILYQNGKPLDIDIFFQYGCITGLQKIAKTR